MAKAVKPILKSEGAINRMNIYDNPVGALEEIHQALSETAAAGESIPPMRQAAIQMLVEDAVRVVQSDFGGQRDALRREVSSMAETARLARGGDISWSSLQRFLEQVDAGLRTY